MASSYTGLGTELMATGEEAGTWGSNTNTNLQILEQIAGGYTAQALETTGATTLSVSDGSTGATLAHRVIEFTAALAGNVTVTIPLDVQTFYIIKNSCTNAYSVEFKYVSGTGGSVTWASGDTGTKIVYATANDATDPDIVDATTDFVTATSTTTLTNKTLTAPKFADAGYIADASGNELIILQTTGSAVNQFDVSNNATGSNPIFEATGGDSNVGLDLKPKGSGEIVVGSGGAAATITTKGAYDLTLDTNAGSSSGTITITDASNGAITLTPNGSGVVDVAGSMNPSVSSTGKAMVLGF